MLINFFYFHLFNLRLFFEDICLQKIELQDFDVQLQTMDQLQTKF